MTSRGKPGTSPSYRGDMADSFVSFHVRRSQENVSKEQRPVVFFRYHKLKLTFVPGIRPTKETKLYRELTSIQNKKSIEKNGFLIEKLLFSFVWRFGGNEGFVKQAIQQLEILDPQITKKVLKDYKKYLQSLDSSLVQGNIYLIPDTEILFSNPKRFRQPYARRVLILQVHNNQLWIIPFSTRLDKADPARDIVFDPSSRTTDLGPDARPAIDNFPYQRMNKKNVLCIQAAQPLTRDQFLSAALVSIGALKKETLQAVQERIK